MVIFLEKLFSKNKNQNWAIRQTILILDFKMNHNPFNLIDDESQTELRLSEAEHIDNNLNLDSILTIFQYLKDRYMKNDKLHITVHSCLKGPIISWMDYQRNYAEMVEALDKDIMLEEEEQSYWNHTLSWIYFRKYRKRNQKENVAKYEIRLLNSPPK
jgi:hypothetical protein